MNIRVVLTQLIALTAFVLISGCDDIAGRFKNDQDRINAAVPPSIEVSAFGAAAAAAAGEIDGRRARIESEIQAFMRLRAAECAKGVTLSWFDSATDLRTRLTDRSCFVARDAELLAWLRRIHIGTHLLRPAESIEGKPIVSTLLFEQEIERIRIAERGPYALVSHANSWRFVDFRTGKTLREAKRQDFMVPRPRLSSNGRVAVVVPSVGRVLLEDVESGQPLLDMGAEGFSYVNWVGDTMAVANSVRDKKSLLIDFKTGRHTELPRDGPHDFFGGALPTSVPGEFLLTGTEALRLVQVDSRDAELAVTSLREIPLMGTRIGEGSTLSSDGRYLLGILAGMVLVDLHAKETTAINLGRGGAISARPHADADKFFLTAFAEGNRPASFLLDVTKQTVARLSEGGEGRTLWQYWPAAKRYVTASGVGLRVVDAPPATETPELVATFAARLQQVENERKLAAVDQGPTRTVPPMLTLPAGSKVLAVGAYESRSGSHGVGRPRVAGAIDVTVMRTSYPVVLVLSSYEPVNWRIQLAPGANLFGVLLFGYYESSLVGHGSAKVHRGGQLYAYKRQSREFDQLNREVLQLTGAEINSFQGDYAVSRFSVGSW